MKHKAKDPIRSIQTLVKGSVEYTKLKTICELSGKTIRTAVAEAVAYYLSKHTKDLDTLKNADLFEEFKRIANDRNENKKGSLALACMEAMELWFEKLRED